jgi:hypothetical protein
VSTGAAYETPMHEPTNDQVINAPNARKFKRVIVIDLVFTLWMSFIAWLAFRINFVVLYLVILGIISILFVLYALREPMLKLKPDGIHVVRWYSLLFGGGTEVTYPWQPCRFRQRQGARGGSWVSLRLVDSHGVADSFTFFFIQQSDLQKLADVGATGFSPPQS